MQVVPAIDVLTPISRTIGRKYQDKIIVARWSKRPNMDFGRTTVKLPFTSTTVKKTVS